MMPATKSYALNVSGRVQGVGFRYFTRQTAVKLALDGFVKNQADGSVYIEVTGKEGVLNEFIAKCYKGPPFARVDDINIQEIPDQHFNGFQIR